MKTKKIKRYLKWFFEKTDNNSEILRENASLYKMIEELRSRVEELEYENTILMKDIRQVANSLDERINILTEDLCTKN
tara:strand:- start:83 stop:316 length:234 start_codon:yes stop_codon:yes gene_type:complete